MIKRGSYKNFLRLIGSIVSSTSQFGDDKAIATIKTKDLNLLAQITT